MARNSRVTTGWASRHMGNCFIGRSRQGWVVSLLHSEGITGPSDFLVPFVTADGRKRPPLAARLRRVLTSLVTDLGGARRIGRSEAAGLLRVPDMGPLWRRGARWHPPGIGDWTGRGRICPARGQSGLSYLTARTNRGWLVLLRSLWGAPCGSYLVPFDMLPFPAEKWNPDFFVRPLRQSLTHLHGTRRIGFEELMRLRGWNDEEMLEDKAAA